MTDPTTPQPPPYPSFQPPAPPRKGPSAGLLLGLGCLGFLVLAGLGIVAVVLLSDHGTKVSDTTVLRMKLSGAMPEYAHRMGFEELLGRSPVTIRQHVFNLEKAAMDKRVKGVLLELEGTSAGWAKVEELRDALTAFKKSGKFVVAWSEMMSEKEYGLALAADEVWMPEDAFFEFNGLATDVSHYPGLLEKLGIEVQYFRYGKYKSVSGEQMGRKAFTEPVKEMIRENLEVVYGHFVDAVASARGLEPGAVRALLEEGRLKSDWAKENKLIDRLGYFDQLEASLKERLHLKDAEKVKYVTAARYREVSPTEAGLQDGKDVIALLYSVGLIVAGKGSDDQQGSEPLIKGLKAAVEDDRVKAILLRVDSPGGAGLGCDYVRREVERAKAKKPVIVSMSDVAASGGYWVSMDATAIVAQPSTATGSIGIFSVIPNLGGLYEKLGLNNETFKVGGHADALIGARKMSDEEARRFDQDLLGSYNRFVTLAAEGRGMEVPAMQEVAQGRTWYGSQALEKKLVDKLGGFPAAIALAKEKAGLPADRPVRLELFDHKQSWMEQLAALEDDGEGPGFEDAALRAVLKASGLEGALRKAPGMVGFTREVLSGRHTVYPLAEVVVDYR